MRRWLVLVGLLLSGCAVHVQEHPWFLCRATAGTPYLVCQPIPDPTTTAPRPEPAPALDEDKLS